MDIYKREKGEINEASQVRLHIEMDIIIDDDKYDYIVGLQPREMEPNALANFFKEQFERAPEIAKVVDKVLRIKVKRTA